MSLILLPSRRNTEAHKRTSTKRRSRGSGSVPFAALAIPLGLAGTGAAWSAAASAFQVTPLVGELLFAASLLGWTLVLILRLPLTRRRWQSLLAELRDPLSGPFPAYVPIVALLLTAHYSAWLPRVASVLLCLLWVTLLVVLCGYLLSRWLGGGLHLDDVHPGYSLPAIAGIYIASVALSTVGLPEAALAAFGAGTFGWVTIGTIILARLVVGRPLPPPLTPTLSVITTPPITAALAWFAYTGGSADAAQILLLGVITLLVAMQPFFIPTYRRAPFGASWWAILFPIGALASYAIRWDLALHSAASTGLAIAVLTTATITLTALATASVTHAALSRRSSSTRSFQEAS